MFLKHSATIAFESLPCATMTYLDPRLEVVGNIHVLSAASLSVTVIRLMYTSCLRSVSSTVFNSAYSFAVLCTGAEYSVLLTVVDRICCLTSLMWHLNAAEVLGICLRMISAVSPGHMVNLPASMASIHVEGTGLNDNST